MERQLATIQLIDDIQPIPDADSIDVASILGWKVVVKKGEFQIGDKCIYLEIDSLLPDIPIFEFMRSKHFRVKTIKLRKQISQGLAISLNEIFHNFLDFTADLTNGYEIGYDVTDIIGVKKYDNANKVRGADIKGNFPIFISKTDEMRLQSKPRLLHELYGLPYYISLKIDGQSATYYNYNDEFGVCSRNWELVYDLNNVYWQMAERYQLSKYLKNYYIQGEIAGPNIQQNKLGLSKPEFYLYNVGHIDKNLRNYQSNYYGLLQISDAFQIPTVPIIEVGNYYNYSLDALLDLANSVIYMNGKHGEGIVVRPIYNVYSRILQGPLSFKVISPEYLLKNGE